MQLFDSWAGVLPEEQLFRWSLQPMVRIAHALKARHPGIPVIAFPRAVGPASLMYRRPDAFDVLSIDTGLGAHWAARELQPEICLQGNLDPIMVVAGGAAMEREATRILRAGAGPNRGTPVIAVTASATPKDWDACAAAGMNGHVAKPIDPAELFGALAQVLGGVSTVAGGEAAA